MIVHCTINSIAKYSSTKFGPGFLPEKKVTRLSGGRIDKLWIYIVDSVIIIEIIEHNICIEYVYIGNIELQDHSLFNVNNVIVTYIKLNFGLSSKTQKLQWVLKQLCNMYYRLKF